MPERRLKKHTLTPMHQAVQESPAKNTKKGCDLTRRLDLRLPKDHPIFDYPSGTRTAVASALLDVGLKLAEIEERLDNIEECLSGNVKIEASNGLDQEEKRKITNNILSAFE